MRIYQQPNSIVLGSQFQGASLDNQQTLSGKSFVPEYLSGNQTKTLPTAGAFNYSGKSFNHHSEGTFNYTIDFGAKTGQGNINLGGQTTNLEKASIQTLNISDQQNSQLQYNGFGIDGSISGTHQGRYVLGIFGNNAEEVAGYASIRGENDIIFGGVKK